MNCFEWVLEEKDTGDPLGGAAINLVHVFDDGLILFKSASLLIVTSCELT